MNDDLLPLLPSLVALVEETGVSRAAKRMGISQPRMSARLASLRAMTGDPLLVQASGTRGLIATDRAKTLADAAHRLLADMARTFARGGFDPRADTRTFAIMANDNAAAIAGLPLVAAIREEAGDGMRVAMLQFDRDRLADLENGRLDLALGAPSQFERMPTLIARTITRDGFVAATRVGGSAVRNLDDYCARGHVLVSADGGGFDGPVDRALAQAGRRRRVVLSVQSYLLAIEAVATSDMIATLPRALLARQERLMLSPPPMALPVFALAAAWHPRVDRDPAHRWLRDRLTAALGTTEGNRGQRRSP